jgi:hypothetical protein
VKSKKLELEQNGHVDEPKKETADKESKKKMKTKPIGKKSIKIQESKESTDAKPKKESKEIKKKEKKSKKSSDQTNGQSKKEKIKKKKKN